MKAFTYIFDMIKEAFEIIFLIIYVIFIFMPLEFYRAFIRRKCPLHKTRLELDYKCPIIYGLPKYQTYEKEYEKRFYPLANSKRLGGCSLKKGAKKMTKVKFCPECRKAEMVYRKRNKNKKPPKK